MVRLLSLASVVLTLVFVFFLLFSKQPLPNTPYSYQINAGESFRGVSEDLAMRHLIRSKFLFRWLGQLMGIDRHMMPGNYEWSSPISLVEILQGLSMGSMEKNRVVLIEGMTWSEVYSSLEHNPDLVHDLPPLSPIPVVNPLLSEEGELYADTYFYNPGEKASSVVRRAHDLLKRHLNTVWESRETDLPYRNPYEMLIMASLIERETAQRSERPLIASVFLNRLKIGMKLQTDPTVIYGLGDHFDGSLHKKDLLKDSPWNTYTREGLPPTPIGLASLASLQAAAHPAKSSWLYFVSRGNGTHQFSATLEEHNAAVQQYVLSQPNLR
jgi:UPF0755 protein